jgi:NAD(P)-dependent dehydrogenase (short-subunit alcohol dehydrogenase family)
MPGTSSFDPFSQLGQDPEQLTRDLNDCFSTNVISNVHLFNIFMPLILKGDVKKVITLTTGMADQDLVLKYNIYEGAPYAVSKAAMNMVTAKFQAEYEKDGVLFMGICPGMVETGMYDDCKSVHKHERVDCANIFYDSV